MEAFIDWIVSTRLSWFVTEFRWVWPIAETLHFCGLTLLAVMLCGRMITFFRPPY